MTARDVRWHSMRHDVMHARAAEESAHAWLDTARRTRSTNAMHHALVARDDSRESWVSALRCLLEVLRCAE